MILADKIIQLRKQNQMTQEQLAEQLNVSRQSVSKWEGALATPDINKIMAMSQIFGVSTDYLLNDQMGPEQIEGTIEMTEYKQLDLETANAYLHTAKGFGEKGGLSMIIFGLAIASIALSDYAPLLKGVSADVRAVIGLSFAAGFAAIGVGNLIIANAKLRPFEFIQKGEFELAYGVQGAINQKQNQWHDSYIKQLVLGIGLMIVSFIPLFILSEILEGQDGWIVALWMMLFSCGLYVLFRMGIYWSAFEKILNSKKNREEIEEEHQTDKIAAVYWPIVVAIFLGYSLITQDWGRSWIIWPVAGLLFGGIASLGSLFRK